VPNCRLYWLYRAETSSATLITVEADDGTTHDDPATGPPPDRCSSGAKPRADRADMAIGILSDATSATAAESKE
jgi:hypothetical protein